MSVVRVRAVGLPLWAACLVTAALVAATPLAEWLRPTQRTSELRDKLVLIDQVPAAFAGWREDKSLVPVLPDPQLQATVDATYSQVLARTYVDATGRRVMLSIAYGRDQSSETTAVHRPEFCYRSLGFRVREAGIARLALPDRQVTAQRLVAEYGPRIEPISYWVTLDETATLPGLGRKLQQIRYGLAGLIVDGMLVRISTLGDAEADAFALHERFAADLFGALPGRLRPRFFGS